MSAVGALDDALRPWWLWKLYAAGDPSHECFAGVVAGSAAGLLCRVQLGKESAGRWELEAYAKRRRRLTPAAAAQVPANLVPQARRLNIKPVRHALLQPGSCLPGSQKNARGRCARPPSQAAEPIPTHATVLVESMLVNATKVAGRCWDLECNEQKDGELASAAAAAAGGLLVVGGVAPVGTTGPYESAFAILGSYALGVWSHPDARGHAYVIANGAFSDPLRLWVREDTLTPQWGARFEHVPLTAGTCLRLEIYDNDIKNDDDMGIVNIGVDEIVKALQSRETHQVNVQRQTLFVGISVHPEAP